MGLQRKFKKSLDEKWCMRFKTRHPEGDKYDGVVLQLTKDLVVLGQERDFEFEGIHVFPRNSIKGYRDNKFDACCNRILSDNGQIKLFQVPSWLSTCESFHQLASMLAERDIWPAVEVVFADGGSALYLGPIVEIKKNHFLLNCYDAAGKWEKVYRIDFDELYRLEFGTKYTGHFNHYMRRLAESSDK